MLIRKATSGDLDVIDEIYKHARKFMFDNGNPDQWVNGYPQSSLIEQDIENEKCYVCTIGQRVEAVFAYVEGEDPTYARIFNGEWKNNKPYGTIHRLASSGNVKGIANFCFNWCFEKCGNLRADTHDDNKIMQHLFEKNGFLYCGLIFVENGSARRAYQRVK